jgi:hypothetical protein
VIHAYNPLTGEAGELRGPGQPGQLRKTLSQKTKKKISQHARPGGRPEGGKEKKEEKKEGKDLDIFRVLHRKLYWWLMTISVFFLFDSYAFFF